PPTSPPVAVDDTAETDQGQPVVIDVLANDTDEDTENLILSAVGIPTSGMAMISGTNAIYTPTSDFVGTAIFTYTVSDGVDIDAGTVTVTVNGVQEELEDVDLGFRPSSDGYKFANYGTTQGAADTPSAPVMIEMFGAPAVCKRGTLNEAGNDCVLDSHVFAIVDTTLGKTYGHAYGMTVSSMRFFMGLDQPSDIISGTDMVPLFERDKTIQDHVGRYTLQQSTEPVNGPSGWLRNRTTAEALADMKAELAKGMQGDPLVLVLYSTNSGNSHSLFPYRIQETATNQYDIYVYDANYPLDNTRKVQFDLNSNGWAYFTTIPESAIEINLSGSDETSQIDLRRLSGHRPSNLKVVGSSGPSNSREASTLFATGQPLAFTTENCFKIEGGAEFDNSPDAQGNCKGSNELPNNGALQCLRGSDGLSAESGERGGNQICGLDGSVS
ncbi:MAG: Ig-like domain-containing protein, partial [Chloroflexota bacterium]